MPRRSTLLALPAAAVLLSAATAPPPPIIRKAFGATIVSTYPDHRKAMLWLDPSGSYAAMGRRGDRSDGRQDLQGFQQHNGDRGRAVLQRRKRIHQA